MTLLSSVESSSANQFAALAVVYTLENSTNLKYSYLELLESNEGHLDQRFRQNNSPFLHKHPCLFPENHNLSYFGEGFRDIGGLLRETKYFKDSTSLGTEQIVADCIKLYDII